MTYEYFVRSIGGSSFDNLERLADRLQDALGDEDAQTQEANGWELWQVQTLNDHQGVNGLLLVYRRGKG